jgi:hypothetical protein
MNIISPKTSAIPFGMLSTDFRYFMAKICILLFFRRSRPKFRQFLIITNPLFTSRNQTNFDSNVAIRTFEFSSASNLRAKKQIFSNRGVQSLRAADSFPPCPLRLCGEKSFTELLHTNQIQREFLFNNHICSQNQISRLSRCPKTTNFFKPFPLLLHFSATLR